MLAREPTVIAHPSTRTNNSNLNGKETNIGESIIMPKDIKMDAITISITRNGKNNLPKSHLQHINISVKSHFLYTATKVLASEPTVMAHPSTRTNNNNLKGKETNIGESIIIPNDINIDAMTISITRNGKNNKNPI